MLTGGWLPIIIVGWIEVVILIILFIQGATQRGKTQDAEDHGQGSSSNVCALCGAVVANRTAGEGHE